MKATATWHSERLGEEVQFCRWGQFGQPVLIFPTAGGDAEECERFLMIDTLSEFLSACRLKVYAVDSVAGEAWLKDEVPAAVAARVQNQFDGFIAEEVQEVLPEVVGVKDGKAAGVAYHRMTAVTVEAIKAQQDQIEAQQAEIDRLSSQVEELLELLKDK